MIDFTNLIEALQGKKKQTGAEGRPPLTGGEMPILNIPEQAMPQQASYAGSFPHQPGIMTNPPPTMREQGGLPPSSLAPPVAPPEGTRYGTPLPPEDEIRYGIPVMAGGAQNQETPPPIQPGNNYPVLESVPRSRQLQDKLDSLDKDYSKAVYRNPETGETSSKQKDGYVLEKERGKDRDKSWSNWEKAGAAVLGYLQGGVAGAVQAGTDRNFFEKMGDQNQRAQIMPQIEQAQRSEEFDTQQDLKQSQINNNNLSPYFKQQGIDLKREQENNKLTAAENKFAQDLLKEERAAQRNGDKWKTYIDEETGLVYKTFPNDSKRQPEPLNRPGTNEQMRLPEVTLGDGTKIRAKTSSILGYEGRKEDRQFRQEENERDRDFRSNENEKRYQREVKMKRLQADINKTAADYKAKLDEAKAEKNQDRKLVYLKEAEALRQQGADLLEEADEISVDAKGEVQ